MLLASMMLLPCLLAADAHAEEPEFKLDRVRDIYKYLPPPDAKKWSPDPLVKAIEDSTLTYEPKHVYAMVDKRVHVSIITAVAKEAALYYDGKMKPLDVIASEGRDRAASTTVNLTDSDAAVLFEFFNDVNNELAEVERAMGSKPKQESNVTNHLHQRNVRTYEESIASQRGPIEGKVTRATFNMNFMASSQNVGGCERPVARVVLNQVDMPLFRDVAGQMLTDVPIKATGNVERFVFSIDGDRRLEAWGRCGDSSTKFSASIRRDADKKWSGTANF